MPRSCEEGWKSTCVCLSCSLEWWMLFTLHFHMGRGCLPYRDGNPLASGLKVSSWLVDEVGPESQSDMVSMAWMLAFAMCWDTPFFQMLLYEMSHTTVWKQCLLPVFLALPVWWWTCKAEPLSSVLPFKGTCLPIPSLVPQKLGGWAGTWQHLFNRVCPWVLLSASWDYTCVWFITIYFSGWPF